MSRHLRTIVLSLLVFASGGGPGFGQDTDAETPVYLFSTFKEGLQDGLRFAYTYDGYHWSNVPGLFLKPDVGGKIMRDPSIVQGPDGTYHLVWTSAWRGDKGFGYARSKDLVHWSEQQFIPVMEHEPTTVNVWAPELFYDDVGDRFIICWASTIPGRFPDYLEERENNHRMYYTTTRDFQTFTPTKLFLEPDFSVIDCRILKITNRSSGRESALNSTEGSDGANSRSLLQKDGRRYVLLLKENTRPRRSIRVAFGDTPLGPWENISEPITAHLTEGPTALKLGKDWLIYFDNYGAKAYGAVKTRDFKSFTNVTDQMTFPEGLKHGTVFEATRKDLDYLLRVGKEQVWNTRQPWVRPVPEEEIAKRLEEIETVANRGPFKPTWESITNSFRAPEWCQDAKFGLFIHWGAYSVPAFGSEWYPRNMYVQGSREFKHHVASYGPQSEFGYKDFIPQFTVEKFDADKWAALFKEAGVKYVIPVAEHHDGFPMYDSDMTEWSAKKMGPKRDLLGEQAEAYRRAGIVFGASSHRAEHWWFFDQGLCFESDARDTNYAALYGPASNKRTAEAQAEPPDKDFLDDWLLRSCEIVDKYEPRVMYFDWWICQPVFQPYLKTFAAYYYNRAAEKNTQVAINFKEWEGRSFPDGSGVFDIERGQSADIRPDFWQTCTSVSKNSWGYITNHNYREVGDIVDDLIDIVSKNGTLLLNIGPKPDGTIPEHEQQMLREIGAWLKINGEAIYGTRPWKIYGEGPTKIVAGSFADVKRTPFTGEDIRFTTKGDTLYAVALAWPRDGRLTIQSLASDSPLAVGEVERVELPGNGDTLEWERTAEGLTVTLPNEDSFRFAAALKFTGLRTQ